LKAAWISLQKQKSKVKLKAQTLNPKPQTWEIGADLELEGFLEKVAKDHNPKKCLHLFRV
jgi:hypothetical protein